MHNRLEKVLKYKDGCWVEEEAQIINELPVTLSVNNEDWLTFMCTPIDLEALGVGFLFNEGIIQSLEEISYLRICEGGEKIDIWLQSNVKKPDQWMRTSGCSGGETSAIDSKLTAGFSILNDGTTLPPESVAFLMTQLVKSQDLYRKSGGVHTSVLFDGKAILLSAEDIGRHNTLDKLAGKILIEKVAAAQRIILTTGRVSSEMIQKAGRISASIIISRTSPTSLSIMLAEKFGITLIGYARHQRFTIYSHPERIIPSNPFTKVSNEAK